MILKTILIVICSMLIVACGGGGSSKANSITIPVIDVNSAYTGVRNKALLVKNNSLDFVTAILGRNSGEELISSNNSMTKSLTTSRTQKTINKLTITSAQKTSQTSSLSQEQTVSETEACNQGGKITIASEVDKDNLGKLSLAMINCIEDGVTIDGVIYMNITEYDPIYDEPIAYKISFDKISMEFEGEKYNAIGTQSYKRDDNYIETIVTNMVQIDNNGKETFVNNFTTRTEGLYTEFTGKVFMEDHGYVDVTTPEPTRINNDVLTYVGEIILSGAALSKVKISPDYNRETYIHKQRIDLDENGDGIFEYLSINPETTNWNNLESFSENTPPTVFTETELTWSYNNLTDTRDLDHIWINDNLFLKAFAYDPQGYEVSYQWTLESSPNGNTFEVPTYGFQVLDASHSQSAAAAGFTTGRGMDFQPNVSGIYEFSIKVTDADGFSSIEFIRLTVQENQPPTAVVVDKDGINFLGDKNNNPINLSGTDSSDFENSNLSYLWTIISKPIGSKIDISDRKNNYELTVTPDISGTYVFSLDVTDSQGATDNETISIDIPENKPPSAGIVHDDVHFVGFSQSFNGWRKSTDREDTFLSYQWAIISKPDTSNLDITDRVRSSFGFTPDVVGSYTIEMTVTDSHGASDTETITIFITNNSG